jgi:hypothetical protein
MKIPHLLILSAMLFCTSINVAYSDSSNCVNCGPKEVPGMPTAGNKTIGSLEKLAKADYGTATDKEAYMELFCLKIKQISSGNIGLTFKEMEASPFPVDEYFKTPQCQADGYSNVVKSPLIHLILDDPAGRGALLKKISSYFVVKNKSPERFVQALNSKNTKGETFLDYIESNRLDGRNNQPDQIEIVNSLITFACSSGGVYSKYPNKKCNNSI